MNDTAFLTDIQALRRRARQHIDEGAVTAGYGADRKTVLKLLNDALATEIVCVLRYRRHHFMAKGIQAKSIADEFLVTRKRGAGACRRDRGPHCAVGRRAGLRAGEPGGFVAMPSMSQASRWWA
jgi:hypothetical protein